MSFSLKVKEDAMVACGRYCCLCHKFCGLKMEIHHIKPKAEGGPDAFSNAIPLCFDCHADMRTYDAKHPKGTKYSEAELIRLRDQWYEKRKSFGGVTAPVEPTEIDKKIYKKIIEVLPWSGSIRFLDGNNFAGFSFNLDNLDQIYIFQSLCENPAFRFFDEELEKCKSTLLQYIDDFNHLIGHNTFPTSNMGWNQVPPEWENENSDLFNKVVDEIHDAAKSIVDSYRDLIYLATQRLGVVSL